MSDLFRRRQLVIAHSMTVISHGRRIELCPMSAAARVAVLVDAAGALAALARKHAQLSHVDPDEVAWLVTDPVDAFAVLGRGRWLPTMQRPVLAAPASVEPERPGRRSKGRAGGPGTTRAVPALAGQLSIFTPITGAGEVSRDVR